MSGYDNSFENISQFAADGKMVVLAAHFARLLEAYKATFGRNNLNLPQYREALYSSSSGNVRAMNDQLMGLSRTPREDRKQP